MGKTRKAAKDVAQIRSEYEVWIDHAELTMSDAEWLQSVRWLTLWNVTVPDGFLASLPDLAGIDLRGGTSSHLGMLQGCSDLRCLVVNQIRAMSDLSVLGSLVSLEYLQLYGLKQVTETPSFATLSSLRRLDVGVMRGLRELNGLLDAPRLEELFLIKHLAVSEADIGRLTGHPTLASFEWMAADVPPKVWRPVVDAIGLPKTRAILPKQWFENAGGFT